MEPLIPALALTGCLGLALWGVRLVRDPGPVARFDVRDPGGSRAPAARGPAALILDPLGRRFGPALLGRMGPQRLASIRRRLDAAGRPAGLTIEGYVARKAAFTALMTGVGVVFLLDGNVVMFGAALVFGWLLIDVWLAGVAARRQVQIDKDLPDFLDIVSVTVRAGSGLRAALTRVSEALDGPLGEEMMTSLRQMDLGISRREAFESLRQRNPSEPLGQFVTALLQAEELGVPLSDAVSDLAADMRRLYQQRARRRAAKADPRVNLVVTTLIVPATLILIVTAMIMGSDIDFSNLFGPSFSL